MSAADDYFALMDQPRRPWLDTEALQKKFLSLSSEWHPDRWHNASPVEKQRAHDRYMRINIAFRCLREPKSRLLHLLRLETSRDPEEVQEIPAETTQLFLEVAQLCREVDQFIRQCAEPASPIVKVERFRQMQAWTARVRSMQATLNEWRDTLHARLQACTDSWPSALAGVGPSERLPLQALEAIYRLLSYHERWHLQLQERTVQLQLQSGSG